MDVPAPPAGKVIAIVREYHQLVAALCARRDELYVTNATIEHISGLQEGYVSKLLSPEVLKRLGAQSLGCVLGALGLQLVVQEDVEALALVQSRLVKRKRWGRRARAKMHARGRPFTSETARMARAHQMLIESPKHRKESNRRAAQMRWAKVRAQTVHE